eukprot:TRINITY_DN23058_c0_g1_i8.p3 TRINITY_DN23058_c0_g1~~TRINITY_DN23058_c0_g1_i8.p3  ORF type:complete len:107 (+),score=19.77 TRINITY_DN23058_c0_g1_i8:308-628(+)
MSMEKHGKEVQKVRGIVDRLKQQIHNGKNEMQSMQLDCYRKVKTHCKTTEHLLSPALKLDSKRPLFLRVGGRRNSTKERGDAERSRISSSGSRMTSRPSATRRRSS